LNGKKRFWVLYGVQEFDVSGDVLINCAEPQIEHFNPAEVLSNIELIRDTDCSVNLNGRLTDHSSHAPDGHFAGRRGLLASDLLASKAETRMLND
jgi:hypothetical protein